MATKKLCPAWKKSGSVRFKTTMHSCVTYKVMDRRGWSEVDEESDWDIFW